MEKCNATHTESRSFGVSDHAVFVRLAHLESYKCELHEGAVVRCQLEAGHEGDHRDTTHEGEAFGQVQEWSEFQPIPPYVVMRPVLSVGS